MYVSRPPFPFPLSTPSYRIIMLISLSPFFLISPHSHALRLTFVFVVLAGDVACTHHTHCAYNTRECMICRDNMTEDEYGRTALHYAAWGGNLSCVSYLMSVNATTSLDNDGNSPLMLGKTTAIPAKKKNTHADGAANSRNGRFLVSYSPQIV